MPSILKKPASGTPNWYAAFRGADGKRKQKSTGTQDRALAMKIACEFEAAAKKGRSGTLVESQVRKVFNEILESINSEPIHFASTRDFLEDWLRDKHESKRGRTGEKYASIIRGFLQSLGNRAGQTLAAVSPTDLRKWRSDLNSQGLSPATVNNSVKILASAFNRAVRLGYIQENPCHGLDPVRDEEKDQKDAFSPDQIRRLLEVTQGDDWEGVILIGMRTGLRRGDLTNLTWGNIRMDASGKGVVQVKTSKTGIGLVVPIHPDVREWLLRQSPGVGKAPLFPTLAGKSGSGKSGISMQFSRIMAKAGIQGRVIREGSGKGRRTTSLTLHSLRNTFISNLANSGVPEDLRMRLVGHKTKDIHRGYTQHDMQTLTEAVEAIPSIR
jgi:integrase